MGKNKGTVAKGKTQGTNYDMICIIYQIKPDNNNFLILNTFLLILLFSISLLSKYCHAF